MQLQQPLLLVHEHVMKVVGQHHIMYLAQHELESKFTIVTVTILLLLLLS